MKVVTADFVKSAADPEGYPREGLPEFAFAGRSNVGKSSLINALTGRKKLAKTSGNPGHTRLLNFFRINDRCLFADLPGYGYAKAPRNERRRWKTMVEDYLNQRRELRAVIIILDIRRTPGVEEIELITWLTARGIPPLPVVTKADKLGKTKRTKPLREIASALGLPTDRLLVFSSLTGEGREQLWKKLGEFME